MAAIKTLFVITVATARMIFPGIPAGPALPAGQEGPSFNTAAKSLTMDLSCGASAGEGASAEVAVPNGLKVGNKVKLHIGHEQPAAEAAARGAEAAQMPNIKIKTYWGSAATVPAGQPRVISPSQVPKSGADKAADASQAAAVPTGTFAYWPGPGDHPLKAGTSAQGAYTLTTNFCGGASVTLGKEQDFLAPLELVGMDKQVDPTKAIKVQWKSVPNAIAYRLTAVGGSQSETITWTSSSKPDAVAGLEYAALPQDRAKKLIDEGVLLGAKTTSCTIPAGIFSGSSGAMLMVTAFGNDKIQDKDGMQTQVIVRSTASAALMSAPVKLP